MRTFIPFLFVLILMGCSAPESPAPQKPNILILLADDLGYSDLGCYGSEIETPNIDRLAAEGLSLTQFYNCTRCGPSRASLLTGLYPHQAGMGGNKKEQDLPGYLGHLNEKCATLPELLKPMGYRSYMAGKWHVGDDSLHWPMDHGFDQYFGLISGASSYYGVSEFKTSTQSHRSKFVNRDQEYVPPLEGFYSTTAYTDSSIAFLEAHDKDKPFFLYLAYQAPHWPLHAPEATIKKYQGTYMEGWDSLRVRRYQNMIAKGLWNSEGGLSDIYEDFHQWDTLSLSDQQYWDQLMATYAATIDEMDQQIGRLIAYLEAQGQLDNTLILFLSDNGACYDDATVIRGFKTDIPAGGPESFNGYGMGWANLSNVPFRLFKAWGHEGGISGPFIARYPKFIRPGTISSQMAHIIDIVPTILELSGASYSVENRSLTPLPSQSLMPLLKGEVYQEPPYLGWEHIGNRAFRKGKWKIVSEKKDRTWHLYNIEQDRIEMQDSALYYPELLAEMIGDFGRWCDTVQALK